MRRTFYFVVVLLAAGLLTSGCRSLITPPTPFEIYDLGPGYAGNDVPLLVPSRVELVSPTWLATTAMQYRLDYLPVAPREAYSQSRWAGHPGEMLERLVEAGLSREATQGSHCRLLLDLDDFVQRFDEAAHSRSEVAVRARLLAPQRESVLARESFRISVEAPTPDAAGGVEAHRQAATQLVDEVFVWLNTLAADEEAYIVRRCLGPWRELERVR